MPPSTTQKIELAYAPEQLVLTVADHGTGFQAEGSQHAGQGLHNMRDRAASIGAELTIQSNPADGTLVRMVVPLELTLLEQPQ
jgi:signal transduction histidine kinase